MANNKNFISPGLYSKIEDLSQATASIGETTLGLVGETLKGPAFQPIKIESTRQYFEIFGGTSPVKNGTNPRYEASYIANSFLTQSSSLYVTRVLGTEGYEAKDGYILTFTVGGVKYPFATLRHDSGVSVSLGGSNLFEETTIDVDVSGVVTTYDVSFDKTSNKYISLVLPKNKTAPFYLENVFDLNYPNLGDGDEVDLEVITNKGNFQQEYKYPVSPVIVSDLSTGVKDLFTIVSVSDGNSANSEIKVSFENLRIDSREFDVLVRSYNDTDKNPVVLEAFRRVNMNPSSSNYIAKRIGSFDGVYDLYSKYISIDVNEEAPVNGIPAGFKGYKGMEYVSGLTYELSFKKIHTGSTPRELRQFYLGYDFDNNSNDFLHYQGYDEDVVAPLITKGFHLEDLSNHVDASLYDFVSGTILSDTTGNYTNILSRRFSVGLAGGFDGWDVHKATKSFDTGLLDDGSYTAYLQAVKLMMNPDELPINLLATGGIDYSNHNNLVLEIIDMLEMERGDCFYVVNSPDIDIEPYDSSEVYAQDLSSRLDAANIDSMYAGTYASWVKHYDAQNGVNIFLPPTFEVVTNMAEVDRRKAPWFATAGYNNGQLNSSKAKVKLNQFSSDILYDNRINPIRTFTNSPLLIFGNKNLLVNEESALNRVNVVRLLIQIQKLISVVAVRLLFEPNDDELQDEFIRVITPILDNVQKQRGIIAYQITCDKSNNTDADRDRLQLNGEIRIKPTLALEYINLTYSVTDQGAVFS